MREHAKREAELIVAEAHAEARSVMRSGQGERERLLAEVRRIESLLRSALGDRRRGRRGGLAPGGGARDEPVQPEPRRDEPREFPLVRGDACGGACS